MKSKKKYCLNMSSYKYKSGFRQLLPPIIIKESNCLNINLESLIPTHNKCPSGKICPNYCIILELKQEIIKLLDKISQLKKIAELNIPHNHIQIQKYTSTAGNIKGNITPKRERIGENEKNNLNIYNQLINSFRNSSKNKNKALEIKNNNIIKYNLLNPEKSKTKPNSAKNLEIKESFENIFMKDKNKSDEKKIKLNEIKCFNINKKINLNFVSSSKEKEEQNEINILNYNKRYENDNNINENNIYYRKLNSLIKDSNLTTFRKSKTRDLSSLNLHLSNSIISPAIKITPKNLFDSLNTNRNNINKNV